VGEGLLGSENLPGAMGGGQAELTREWGWGEWQKKQEQEQPKGFLFLPAPSRPQITLALPQHFTTGDKGERPTSLCFLFARGSLVVVVFLFFVSCCILFCAL
jgi:hypothetical protein